MESDEEAANDGDANDASAVQKRRVLVLVLVLCDGEKRILNCRDCLTRQIRSAYSVFDGVVFGRLVLDWRQVAIAEVANTCTTVLERRH